MADATIVAQAFRYPIEGSRRSLEEGVAAIANPKAQKAMRKFLAAIPAEPLSAWEELHTVTLDLSPLFVPYVGHAVWGENYRRGAFMADLSRLMAEAGVDKAGELPDHLDPVLRYLDATESPLGDLVEVLPVALMRMSKELHKADKRNPYRHALDAAQAVAEMLIEAKREVAT